MQSPTFDQDAARHARRRTWIAVAILALAVALRVFFATRKGLVLDEFHSYFHATRDSLSAFFETLREDNHPPLSFLIIRAARAVFGDGELALRAPAMVYGLLEILLVGRIARRFLPGAGGVALIAMALVSVSSLHLDFSTQARMYALHGLCVTGVVEALLSLLSAPAGERARGPAALLALWSTLGLHNHYFFLQYLGLIGVATIALLALAPETRPRLKRLVAPALLTATLCAPWYAFGFPHQLEHALPPGGDDVGPRALAEAFVHLFFLNVRLGGPELRIVFIACGGAAVLLGLASAWRLLAHARDVEQRLTAILLATVAFAVPTAAVVVAQFAERAGFTWHYVLPSTAALALLVASSAVGAGPLAGVHRAAAVVIGCAALLLSTLNAASRGSEDYPGAVAHILASHEPSDLIVSVEWQPALFPQGQPWDYYAPRSPGSAGSTGAGADPPERLPMNGFSLTDPRDLKGARRVLVLRTSLPGDQPLMRLLHEDFRVVGREGFGFGIEAMVFERND